MPKRQKDRMYYEITKEKPLSTFHLLLAGGAAGSILAFLIVSLLGACVGMEMDALVLAFLIASFLGFFFGAFLTWLAQRYLGNFVSRAAGLGSPDEESLSQQAPVSMEVSETGEIPADLAPPTAVEGEEDKGKSVDFVFPELSPDKQ